MESVTSCKYWKQIYSYNALKLHADFEIIHVIKIDLCTVNFIYVCFIIQDTLHSSMAVVTRLCSRIELNSDTLPNSIESLSSLLHSDDPYVCFYSLLSLM